MTISATATKPEPSPAAADILISADSHVVEPTDLWTTRLRSDLRDRIPVPKPRVQYYPGATDPADRIGQMRRDGVSMEVLYPTFGLSHFHIEDAELQENVFRVYNDWIIEYCAALPQDRIIGQPSISLYDIDHAIAELKRCREAGLKGATVWHVPHPDLPFTSDHYDRFWAAAQEMEVPIAMHILTGFDYSTSERRFEGLERYRTTVESKLSDAIHTLFDLIFYGVLERYPQLNVVFAENEIGWVPWVIQQWDFYVKRFEKINPAPIKLLPSEYFARQMHFTFFNDHVGTRNFEHGWGVDNCMWSNDFPHGNSTWPNSRDVINRDVSKVDSDTRSKVLGGNAARLYQVPVPDLLV
jgi:uncharacterized protein